MLESLVLRFGYVAIGVGTLLEGETVLIAGAALAHRGLLSLPLVMVVAFVGAIAGDQLWFQLGVRLGPSLLDRRPRWKALATRADAALSRFGAIFVLGFRFIYGIRTVTPIVLGARRYPALRFAVLNVLGAALWVIVFGVLGWVFGAGLEGALKRASRVEELLLGAVGAMLVVWTASRRLFHRWSAPHARVSVDGDGAPDRSPPPPR